MSAPKPRERWNGWHPGDAVTRDVKRGTFVVDSPKTARAALCALHTLRYEFGAMPSAELDALEQAAEYAMKAGVEATVVPAVEALRKAVLEARIARLNRGAA